MNKITRDRWKTRRLMAWLCLSGLAAVLPLTMMMDKDWLVAAAGVIIALITLCGSIIMVYIGFATMDDMKR